MLFWGAFERLERALRLELVWSVGRTALLLGRCVILVCLLFGLVGSSSSVGFGGFDGRCVLFADCGRLLRKILLN